MPNPPPVDASHEGNLVDVKARRIFPGRVRVEGGRIVSIEETDGPYARTLLPGLVDAHVHIESSMLVPSEFARMAVVHGTVATVSDPHEIANVLGLEGVRFMVENGRSVPFTFLFGASPCVPATGFETAGAELSPADVEGLFRSGMAGYLAEVMNVPGVLQGAPDVLEKLALARRYGRPVDGHAPLLEGAGLEAYVRAGISTEHEATTLAEGRRKAALGMKILIREGSASRDFDALQPLLREIPDRVMFCSDDKHPDDLLAGHIDGHVRRALALGHDVFDVLRAATLNPVEHYGLPVGLLQSGDPADFIVVDDLRGFRVRETWVRGRLVARDGRSFIPHQEVTRPNRFALVEPVAPSLFRLEPAGSRVRVIRAKDGSVLTDSEIAPVLVVDGNAVACPARDCPGRECPGRECLKLAVLNRYREAPPAVAFVSGFGLRTGALATSVAHDSHNVVAVGASDEALAEAVNLVIEHRGGLAAVGPRGRKVLPLPVAGLMSHLEGPDVARLYAELDAMAKADGSPLRAPFMTLSFMALLVIPHLKLGDRGLFDGDAFGFTELFLA